MLLNLDRFELLSYIEGCARGSHLRQGIWEKIVKQFIGHFDDEEDMDFIWWICRRDIWDIYMSDSKYPHFGQEYFLHAMAALHKNNYAWVHYEYEDENGKEDIGKEYCYRWNGHWYPKNSWNSYICEDFITSVDKVEYSDNESVEYRHMDLWNDLSIYETYEPKKYSEN